LKKTDKPQSSELKLLQPNTISTVSEFKKYEDFCVKNNIRGNNPEESAINSAIASAQIKKGAKK